MKKERLAGADDGIVEYPSEVFAVPTGIYVLTNTFTGAPDPTVHFAPGVGGTGVSAKDEVLVSPKLDVESTIFEGL